MTISFLLNSGKSRVVSGIFRALILSLLFAAFACIPAAADPVVQITQCGTTITQPGHYIVANDLNCGGPVAPTPSSPDPANVPSWQQMQNPFTSSGAQAPTPAPSCSAFGILILSDHVDLALDGHTISGCSNFSTFGISVGNPFSSSVGQSHVHIVGPGTITGWFVAVVLTGSSFSSVSEVTADTNGIGFIDITGSKNAFDGNTATNNLAFFFVAGGITLLQTTGDAVRNNTVSGNFLGIVDENGGSGNDIRFNTVNGNFVVGIGIVSTGDSIFHNTAQGTIGGPDLNDVNANCDNNMWMHNTFGSAIPSSCIN